MCSSRAYPAFMATFPVSEDQPAPDNPRYPFIGPRPAYALDRSPERPANARACTSTEKRCLLDPQGRQRDFVFNNGGVLMGDAFRNINVVLPIPTANTSAALAGGFVRSAMFGPFYHRQHSLVIRLVIDDSPVDQPGKNKEKVVTWRVPIQIATSILTIPGAETSVSVPPYAQIFHENGEARMCEPLPSGSADTKLPIPLSKNGDSLFFLPSVAHGGDRALSPRYVFRINSFESFSTVGDRRLRLCVAVGKLNSSQGSNDHFSTSRLIRLRTSTSAYRASVSISQIRNNIDIQQFSHYDLMPSYVHLPMTRKHAMVPGPYTIIV